MARVSSLARWSHTDISIAGRGPTPSVTRSYNSADSRVGILGPGWTFNYNMRLRDPGDGSGDVLFVRANGNTDRFTENGGSYDPAPATAATLVKNVDETFTVTEVDGRQWIFQIDGDLAAVKDRFGNTSTLTYNESGQLTAVSDPAARGSLTFAYTGDRLTSVTDWASPARTVSYGYDANGRLETVTDREANDTTYGYDGTSQRLTTITDARSHVAVTMTYDGQGRVATQKDARGLTTGDTTTFSYVVNGDGTRVTTTTLPATSFEASFTPTIEDHFSAQGFVTSRVVEPSSTETLTESYTYDSNGFRASVTNASGNTTNYCYDVTYAGAAISGSRGNLTRVIGPPPTGGANRPVTLTTYDSKNNVTQVVTPLGVPSGTTVTCSTDLSSIDSDYATDFAYDGTSTKLLSTTTRATDPDTGSVTSTTKYEYGDSANPGLVTRIIPPRGNTTGTPDYSYAVELAYFTSGSKFGMLQSREDALGNVTTFDYDAVGRLVSSVDPLGNEAGATPADHRTEYTYDKEDRVLTVELPAPTAGGSQLVTETEYDDVGNAIVKIDANGQVTTYAYDDRDALSQVKESPNAWTNPASPPSGVITTEYTYDANGNLTRVLRAKGDSSYGRATDYTYDGRNLVRSEKQYPSWPSTSGPLTTTSTYTATGQVNVSTDALSRTTTSSYDALDRRTGLNYSDSGTPDVTWGYDANGNRTSMVDGTGTSAYTYDESDRLLSVTTPGSVVVGYRYDRDGNRTKLIYPDSTAVTYAFDKAGRLSSATDWASRATSYTYAADGLPKGSTNANSTTTSYSYDNARRLLEILHEASGGADIEKSTYTLDAVGNVSRLVRPDLLAVDLFARPDGVAGVSGTWTGTHADIDETSASDADFIASPSSPPSGTYFEATLGDVAGPASVTGVTVRYRYDKSANGGKQIDLTVELRQGNTVIASANHSNISGSWTAGSITLTAGERASITNWADLRVRFSPTASGGGSARTAQISWAEVEVTGYANAGSDDTYSYDKLYRLTGTSGTGGSHTYTYDPAGNRLSYVAGSTTNYTYDRADRITAAGATSITVNAVGATTAKGSDSFTYDQANRMTSATVSGTTETYTYDGDGVRFSRQVGAGPVTRYVTDPNRGLPVTIGDGTRKYVWGLGLAYAVNGSSIEVYHQDRLGSARVLTDGSGNTIATYRTDEFGNATGSTGTSGQPFTFTGEPRDWTGLSYLRARYYDPALGRFTSRDTWPGVAHSSQAQNRYVYVNNSPLTHADPSGRFLPLLAAGALLGGAINTAIYHFTTDDGARTSEGYAGAFLGGAVTGAITAVSGPVGGSLSKLGGYTFNATRAFLSTTAIDTAAGAVGSAVEQQIATGTIDGQRVAISGFFSGVGGMLAGLRWPMVGAETLGQLSVSAPRSIGAFLSWRTNTAAFYKASIASGMFGFGPFLLDMATGTCAE